MHCFRNPGTLPILAITTLGVSDKSEDSIGRFGTGLKYTIAGALRLGQEIAIVTGGSSYYFFSKEEVARSKTFPVVWMEVTSPDGTVSSERLGFTTDLGKHWEPWMYIRELYSNCLDEGGTSKQLAPGEIPPPLPSDWTQILVGGKLFDPICRDMPFLLKSKPVKTFSQGLESSAIQEVEFHPRSRAETRMVPRVYYKSILIGELDAFFDYDINILGEFAYISEDRVLSSPYIVKTCVARAVLCSDDEEEITSWLENKTENTLELYNAGTHSIGETASAILRKKWNESPASLSIPWANAAGKLFKADRSSISFELTPAQEVKFTRAKAFLASLGLTQELTWRFVEPTDEGSFGFVSQGEIYITRKAFDNGTQFLAQVMAEEYLHLVKDLDDYSRPLQDWLFAKLIALGEELYGVL